ncbi:DNA topoisomerase III alpha [Phyllostomus discolor]|uniref:DNA topoisomerase n=1 Tax=Phyllostomus discolor TaxID=89673 RepID=A0A833ZJ30_9CHIR|nr:DNA topoisomerase III alpha [Phyllostomus discolor]
MRHTRSTLRQSKPGCTLGSPQTSGFSLGTWAWDLWKVSRRELQGVAGEAPLLKFLSCVVWTAPNTALLAAGYDAMGYEMSKPDLRAELEADLKLICEGKKKKCVVLRQQVQKYKQVFIEAVAKAKKLDEALSQYFGEGAEVAQQETIYPAVPEPVRKCPQCNKDMVLKTKKSGGFYLSCMGFPECRTVMWFPDSVLEASRDGSVCPVCRPHPVYRLKFKFKRGSLPPTMPLEFIGCIGGCDETLREILDLRFSRGAPRAGPPASQPSGYLQAGWSSNRTDSSQHNHPQPPGARQTRPLKALAQNQPPPVAAGESNSVVCNCGQEALLLTVRKEGPNQGRQFYKCQGGSCSFFLWANSSHPETGGPPSSSTRHPTISGNHPHGFASPGDDSGGGTSCLCSQATVTRTVQKDGPNKGRQFHTCAKPREQQCGFFQWVDENVAPGEERALCNSSTTGSSSRAGQGGACTALPQTQGRLRRWWEREDHWVVLLLCLLTHSLPARW